MADQKDSQNAEKLRAEAVKAAEEAAAAEKAARAAAASALGTPVSASAGTAPQTQQTTVTTTVSGQADPLRAAGARKKQPVTTTVTSGASSTAAQASTAPQRVETPDPQSTDESSNEKDKLARSVMFEAIDSTLMGDSERESGSDLYGPPKTVASETKTTTSDPPPAPADSTITKEVFDARDGNWAAAQEKLPRRYRNSFGATPVDPRPSTTLPGNRREIEYQTFVVPPLWVPDRWEDSGDWWYCRDWKLFTEFLSIPDIWIRHSHQPNICIHENVTWIIWMRLDEHTPDAERLFLNTHTGDVWGYETGTTRLVRWDTIGVADPQKGYAFAKGDVKMRPVPIGLQGRTFKTPLHKPQSRSTRFESLWNSDLKRFQEQYHQETDPFASGVDDTVQAGLGMGTSTVELATELEQPAEQEEDWDAPLFIGLNLNPKAFLPKHSNMFFEINAELRRNFRVKTEAVADEYWSELDGRTIQALRDIMQRYCQDSPDALLQSWLPRRSKGGRIEVTFFHLETGEKLSYDPEEAKEIERRKREWAEAKEKGVFIPSRYQSLKQVVGQQEPLHCRGTSYKHLVVSGGHPLSTENTRTLRAGLPGAPLLRSGLHVCF